MTLLDLVGAYFILMRKRPTIEDLARFTSTVPSHLQLAFLGWLRTRADALEAMGYKPRGELLN